MNTTTKIVKGILLVQICVLLFHCTSNVVSKRHPGSIANPVDSGKATAIRNIVSRANAFKSTLTNEQINIVQLPYSKTDAVKWSNLPQAVTHPKRVGISLGQLNSTQIKAAKELMASVLDEKTLNEGFDEMEGNLVADDYFAKETGRKNIFGSEHYYLAFLGTPSITGLWELQFGGHHFAISNTYNNGKLIGMTPAFRGVEPTKPIEANGRHYQPMEQERLAFTKILEMLTENEINTAKLSSTFADILLGPGKDADFPQAKKGLKVGLLAKDKQEHVLQAITLYVKDLKSDEAEKLLAAYSTELQDTYISFSGSKHMLQVNDYLRIDGPSVWIEFSIQSSRDIPGTTHPHSIWRDRRSDYGGK